MSFEMLTSRWHDDKNLPAQTASLVKPLPNEVFIGLNDVELAAHKQVPAWLLLSTHRILIVRDLGRSLPALTELHHHTLGKSSNRFSRDTLDVEATPYILIPMLLDARLRELLDLALLPPIERAISAAKLLISEEELYHEANILLEVAQRIDAPTKDTDEALPDVVATAPDVLVLAQDLPLTPAERILIWRAKCTIAIGAQGAAIDHLVALTTLRPHDDLIASTTMIGQNDVRWWLPIALAHEEAGDMTSAASVYDLLYTHHPAHHGFLLSRAQCLKRALRTVEALAAYTEYIALQTATAQAFLLTPSLAKHQAQHEDDDLQQLIDVESRDFALACEELGELYEQRAEWRQALDTYLVYIQHDPFVVRGYELALRTHAHLSNEPIATTLIAQAMLLYRLLDPVQYKGLVIPETLPESPCVQDVPPVFSGPLPTTAHDDTITHPGERMRSNGAQKWLSGLMVDKESTRDIERHCQRLSASSHDVLFESLSRLAEFLSVPTPRCYLSHGMTGVQVYGEDASEPALMLLGAAHLDPEHPQYLTPRQMVFAFATQLEHIKAGHLMLTSSEFWGAFRDKALSGGIALLSLIPVGNALGKFADGLAGPLLDQLKRGFDNKLFASMVKYLEKQLEDGATHGQIQGAYESTIGALLLSERRASQTPDQQSLIKEQLADFARCAMYTSDRLGLLANDSLEDAVHAIMLLSSYHGDLAVVQRSGLRAFLERTTPDGELMHEELALRFSEIFKFALSSDYAKLKQELVA